MTTEEFNIRADDFIIKDSGARKEFSGGFVRDITNGKTRYDLLDLAMLKRWANHMAKGAMKYGERNWEKAEGDEAYNRFKESAFRHFIQWFSGEVDEDHASAVMFNISGAEMVLRKKEHEQK